MRFITNRKLASNKRSGEKQFVLNDNAPLVEIFFCEREASSRYTEIGSQNAMQSLKASPAKQLLFYIHGFSNLPEKDIFPRAQELQRLFDQKQKDLVEVIPVIWPCDNDMGVVKDYFDDQKSADMSGMAFARCLQFLMAWQLKQQESKDPCLKRMNILAHSMGNRVLREALAAWDKYYLHGRGVPALFRNIFMVAADVVNETLHKGQPGALIAQAARNLCVYFASDDLALRGSKGANIVNGIASKRLGHTGPEDPTKVPKNVVSVDCDNFNTVADHPTGHTYFTEPHIFAHIYNAVATGRPEKFSFNSDLTLNEYSPQIEL